MQAISYYLLLPLIYLISLLPFSLLYLLSDFIYLMLYKVVGYRKKVVYTNLKNSFPEKSKEELKSIESKFYRYFCDLILETFKSLTISEKELRKRIQFPGLDVFEAYAKKKQSVIIVMGHWGNWELGGARFAIEPIHQLMVIYHPLNNQYFNKLIVRMRTRLGNGLYAMKDSIRMIIADKNKLTATAFIADQTPSPKSAHWMTFMNQETPVFTGVGRIATKLNDPVIYIGIERLRRGYYKMFAEELFETPKESGVEEIIEAFTHRLEEDIKMKPEIWLWSHRRWKHKRA